MSTQTSNQPLLAADGRPLKQSLSRALRRQKLRALALVADYRDDIDAKWQAWLAK